MKSSATTQNKINLRVLASLAVEGEKNKQQKTRILYVFMFALKLKKLPLSCALPRAAEVLLPAVLAAHVGPELLALPHRVPLCCLRKVSKEH